MRVLFPSGKPFGNVEGPVSLTRSERLQARHRPAQDKGVDVVGSFVGVDGFQVQDVADDVVFVGHPVAAQHVARRSGDIQRLAAVVAFHQADGFRGGRARVLQAAQLQRALQAQCDFGLHVGQL